ncbi:MAG: hypothetical protein JWN92_2729 [Candidatus Acidoferrum typicum]|nr:hypothetical protein [Candidatus Acidoferrum typicum]
MHPKRMLFAAVVSALFLPGTLLVAVPGHAQESVADAARKAQAAKKPSAKPAAVFTNDNIDTIKGTINVVGDAPEPPADQASDDKGEKGKKPAGDAKAKSTGKDDKTQGASADDKKSAEKGEDYWRQTFTDARKKMADDAHELDILQRDYNLKQQQYYSDPNVAMRQQFSRQDLTDTKTQIDDKAAAVAADKQALSDLEDQLRKAGGEPGWANPSP